MAEYGETPTPPKSKPPTKFEQKFIESFTKRGKTLSLEDARKRLKRGKIIAGLTFGFILLAIVAPREETLDRPANQKCNSDSPECKQWTKLAIKCDANVARREAGYMGKLESWCGDAEEYREKVTGIDLSSNPGAYIF